MVKAREEMRPNKPLKINTRLGWVELLPGDFLST
jgi:hypothetical protein